jgi:hypothetical protein
VADFFFGALVATLILARRRRTRRTEFSERLLTAVRAVATALFAAYLVYLLVSVPAQLAEARAFEDLWREHLSPAAAHTAGAR